MRRAGKAAAAAAVIVGLCVAVFGNPAELYRRRELRQAMAGIEDGTVTLNEVVPFAWDSAYRFDPYATREEMEEIMGVSARGLEESVSEGTVQLAFVKGDRVVCGVCEPISRAGYDVFFGGKVTFAEEAVFEAERSPEGILRLTALPE